MSRAWRNETRSRHSDTRVGTIELAYYGCEGMWRTFRVFRRSERALMAALVAMVLKGMSTNCLLSVLGHCLTSRNDVKLFVTSKQMIPQWLDMDAAREHRTRSAVQRRLSPLEEIWQ